ncbi:MAG TPA: DUF4266 domain-containing protein [Polyangiaceae bacterium]
MNRVPLLARAVARHLGLLGLAGAAVLLGGCATVAPEQRAILADPTMQFDADAKHDAALNHAMENREGSMGGTGVSGGGCGCN